MFNVGAHLALALPDGDVLVQVAAFMLAGALTTLRATIVAVGSYVVAGYSWAFSASTFSMAIGWAAHVIGSSPTGFVVRLIGFTALAEATHSVRDAFTQDSPPYVFFGVCARVLDAARGYGSQAVAIAVGPYTEDVRLRVTSAVTEWLSLLAITVLALFFAVQCVLSLWYLLKVVSSKLLPAIKLPQPNFLTVVLTVLWAGLELFVPKFFQLLMPIGRAAVEPSIRYMLDARAKPQGHVDPAALVSSCLCMHDCLVVVSTSRLLDARVLNP